MSIFTWLLTFILVLDCLLLILLVLIQLPKKEAGIGQSFGGAATDALFGAGSGNALTKVTKYTAGIFFVLTLLISVLHAHQARARLNDPRAKLSAAEKIGDLPVAAPAKPAANTNASLPLLISTNSVKTNAAAAVSAAAPAASTPAATTNK